MEAIVYENISDASLRLERLKLALLALVGVRATAPAVTAILLPIDLLPVLFSLSSASSTGCARTAIENQVRQVCADRAQLLKWLQRDLRLAVDLWVAAAVEPRDAAEVSLLASWQLDRHRSPLRQVDVVCLSPRRLALLWGDVRCQPPVLSQFLLSHQSLLLDVTCCLGDSGSQLLDPAALSSLQTRHLAKGRTSAVVFYNAWLQLISTPRGLAQLQLQLRAVSRHILLPLRLPLCCSYGGDVGVLQRDLVTLPFPRAGRVHGECEGNAFSLGVSASLLATRSLQDTCSLVALLLGHPLVNYYNEAMAYCASAQRRRRVAGFVYAVSVVSARTATDGAAKRVSMVLSSRERTRKRARKGKVVVRAASAAEDGADEAEEPLWCEDIGS